MKNPNELLYIIKSRIYFQQPWLDVQEDETYVPVTIGTGISMIASMRLDDACNPDTMGLADYWLEPIYRKEADLWN
jgi:hypothetical protein